MNFPPYLSRTPPPLNGTDEEDNDDQQFGTFVVSSDLGEEVFDVFEKTSQNLRCEDNISEDSGLCMNSVGQTQSPCDISPLSSSYNNRGNDCANADTQGATDVESSTDDRNSTKVVEESEEISDVSLANNIPPNSDEDVPVSEVLTEIGDVINSGGDDCDESKNLTFQNSLYLEEKDKEPLNINNTDKSSEENEFSDFSESNIPSNSAFVYFSGTIFSEVETTCDNTHLGNARSDQSPNFFYKEENIAEASQSFEIPSFNAFETDEVSSKIVATPKTNDNAENVDDWMSDDEFSDFTSFQSTSSCIDKQNIEVKTTDFDNHFSDLEAYNEDVSEGNSLSVCALQTVMEANVVWKCLQRFEETPAFKYQWSSSFTNMKFLQALQIDSRNILHGPWSRSSKLYWSHVPSNYEHINFNSNFLECSSRSAPKDMQSEPIPDPQFDWVSSGLVNPLQALNNRDLAVELRFEDSSPVLKSKTKNILETLPSLSYVKAHHIVFKRD